MAAITFRCKGEYSSTMGLLQRISAMRFRHKLDRYGNMGVEALRSATPADSGKTASSWDYTVEDNGGQVAIYWTNSNVNQNVNIAVLIQYGHGTGTGGYVEGIDYINPALRPIFEQMANDIWREVVG